MSTATQLQIDVRISGDVFTEVHAKTLGALVGNWVSENTDAKGVWVRVNAAVEFIPEQAAIVCGCGCDGSTRVQCQSVPPKGGDACGYVTTHADLMKGSEDWCDKCGQENWVILP